ncbi:hypothetical protein K439DRAFT_1628137 [Ramaria rubella]|nr:hypothetical protein K439DRAFT_1642409 [Ramaria rubella]KAF8589924.1 hypothetical protein K439DRAFT_1628137 [Ramaria rubella]
MTAAPYTPSEASIYRLRTVDQLWVLLDTHNGAYLVFQTSVDDRENLRGSIVLAGFQLPWLTLLPSLCGHSSRVHFNKPHYLFALMTMRSIFWVIFAVHHRSNSMVDPKALSTTKPLNVDLDYTVFLQPLDTDRLKDRLETDIQQKRFFFQVSNSQQPRKR